MCPWLQLHWQGKKKKVKVQFDIFISDSAFLLCVINMGGRNLSVTSQISTIHKEQKHWSANQAWVKSAGCKKTFLFREKLTEHSSNVRVWKWKLTYMYYTIFYGRYVTFLSEYKIHCFKFCLLREKSNQSTFYFTVISPIRVEVFKVWGVAYWRNCRIGVGWDGETTKSNI